MTKTCLKESRRLIVLLLVIAFLSGCESAPPPLMKGQPVPGFTLERLDGKAVTFPGTAYQGHVVVIDFWADWCALCRDELIQHQRLMQAFSDQGLSVLAINIEQDAQTAKAFITSLGEPLSYDVLLDRQGETARRFGVMGLPVTYVIDRQGNLATRLLGGSDQEQLQKVVRALF